MSEFGQQEIGIASGNVGKILENAAILAKIDVNGQKSYVPNE